jgi:hypothetical protein
VSRGSRHSEAEQNGKVEGRWEEVNNPEQAY